MTPFRFSLTGRSATVPLGNIIPSVPEISSVNWGLSPIPILPINTIPDGSAVISVGQSLKVIFFSILF